MKFKQTRKAIKTIRGSKLQKDFAESLSQIERSKAESRLVGHDVSHLIAMTFQLRSTLSKKTRRAIAEALFADAGETMVGEWERKAGFECGPSNKCDLANKDMTCYRDTNSSSCYSLPS